MPTRTDNSGDQTPITVMHTATLERYYNKETGRFTPLAEGMIDRALSILQSPSPAESITPPPTLVRTESDHSDESLQTPPPTPRRTYTRARSPEEMDRPSASHGRPLSSPSVNSEGSDLESDLETVACPDVTPNVPRKPKKSKKTHKRANTFEQYSPLRPSSLNDIFDALSRKEPRKPSAWD